MELLTETQTDVFDLESLDDETEFKTLVRSIKLSKGFSLFFARSNQIPEQKRLAENLEKEFPGKNIKVIYIEKPIEHLLDTLRETLRNEKPYALILYGLNNSFPTKINSSKNRFVKNLNASRNSFPKIISCPLVLFLPDFAISALMQGATDFFSVRSNVFYFESKSADRENQISQIISSADYEIGSLTIEERKDRINTLKELIKEEQNVEGQFKLHSYLGNLYEFSAEYKKAEKEYELALKLSDSLNNTQVKAVSYNNLAELYYSQGRYAEAESLYRQALAIRENVLGKNHPDTAESYNNLALLYKTQGRYEEAEPLLKKALEIRENVLGENHPDTAGSYNNLAGLYYSQGRYEEAEPLYKQALEIRENVFGENHPDTAQSYWWLGVFYYERGKFQDGLELCEKALKIYRNTLPVGHPHIQNCEGWVEYIKNSIGK